MDGKRVLDEDEDEDLPEVVDPEVVDMDGKRVLDELDSLEDLHLYGKRVLDEDEDVVSGMEVEYDFWDMFEHIWKENRFDEIMWKECLQFCYVFPKNYEFNKDDLIQLWMAQSTREIMETNTVSRCFDKFELMDIFRASRFDYSTGRLRYRLNPSVVDLLQQRPYDAYCRIGDANSYISENTLHCSIPNISFDPITLYRAKKLCTLLIFHERGSGIDQVPRDLFLKLPLLRAVDLSHTNITQLPSSIGKSKHLRYLNLSGTPITTLPISLCSLYQMQTLKLRGCLKLLGLPKGIRKLINLRHLDMDLACLLVSMPPGLGDLTELQSLPAFVVGKQDGCHITELKHMVNLGGTLRVLRLENVSSLEEVKETALDQKKYIHKLELQWSELQDGLELLENLQPHRKLEELQIVGYGGVKFPNWIGDPLFSKLVTVTVHDCRKLELLPPLGKLPFLCDLCISETIEIEVIDHQFCGRNMDTESLDLGWLEVGTTSEDSSDAKMFKAFPTLEKLVLDGMPKLEKWMGMEEGDFPNLQKLSISGCSKLTSLPELSLLKSLQQLEISHCPLLESFPNKGLPTSLQDLVIVDCRVLKEWCLKDEEEECGMLAHIPNVWIDYQQISREKEVERDGNVALENLDHDIYEDAEEDVLPAMRKSRSLKTTVPALSMSNVDKDKDARVDSLMFKPHGDRTETQQKLVFNLSMKSTKDRTRAMKIAVCAPGVVSVELEGDNKSQIVVTGEGIDPNKLRSLLSKKVGFTEFLSITPIDTFNMKQKLVFNVLTKSTKDRTRAMKIAVCVPGVVSVELEGDNKSQIVVKGEGIDPTKLRSLLSKKVGFTEFLSITPIDRKVTKIDEKDTSYFPEARPMSKFFDQYSCNIL